MTEFAGHAQPDRSHSQALPVLPAQADQQLLACHECDQLHQRRSLPTGARALCSRCGALLYRHRANSIERSLSLYLTALVLLLLTISFPFMSISLSGQLQQTHLFSGIHELFHEGYWPLALLVLLTIIVIPLVQISGYLALLGPLHRARNGHPVRGIRHGARLFRWMRAMRPWSMIEVYVLGVLVSLVKLSNYATIIPGTALFSLGALMLVLAAAASALDSDEVWQRLETCS